MHKIRVPDDVAALLRNLHPNLKKKIRGALRVLSTNPHEGRTLRNDLQGLRSYRIGRFRIIYRVSVKEQIEIVAMGPRRSIYEETLRILKTESKKST